MNIAETIKKLPKSELHIHAEAIVTYNSYYTLNKINKVDPSLTKAEDFEKLFSINSLGDMLKSFIFLQTMYRRASDFQLLVNEVEIYCLANNIRYIELHISPSMVLRQGFVDFDDYLDALIEGFDKLEETKGIIVKIICDMSRSFGQENARKNLNLLQGYRAKRSTNRLVGVGLGGQEMGNSCLNYKEILQDAKESGLRVTIHAGEEVESQSIWDAVREVGADRIGHGTSAIFDEKIMDYLTERQTPIEICPTSNLATQKYVKTYPKHPIYTFLERGMNVVLSTDDPVLFDINLNQEYTLFEASSPKVDINTVTKLLKNSLDVSFATDAEKMKLKAELSSAIDEII